MPPPLPGSDFFYVESTNPGLDANRIAVFITLAFGGSLAVSVDTFDYNRVVVNVTVGTVVDVGGLFLITTVDWATVAAEVNSIAGAYVQAAGLAGSITTSNINNKGLLGAGQGNKPGQYYSEGVSVVFNYASAGGSLATQGNYASG